MTRIAWGWLVVGASFTVRLLVASPGAAQCCGSEQCAGDLNCDGQVSISEIIATINNALFGCGASVSADQACTDLAAATCAKVDDCAFNGTTQRYGGATTCQIRQKAVCLERLVASGTGNNPTAVEACVQGTPGASCDDFDAGNIPECESKIGTEPNGAPCAFGGQCESSVCAIAAGTNCGTCAAPTSAGDSCARTPCSHGFTCVAAIQQCEPIGAAGGACDADHPCGAGLTCVTPAGSAEGTCQRSGTSAGAPCDPKHQTAPGCNASMGFYCSAGTCVPLAYVTAGGQCGTGVACTYASTCFGAQGAVMGTCV